MIEGSIGVKILWDKVCYAPRSTNCLSCDHANKAIWSYKSDYGECVLDPEWSFPVFKYGICKYHSDFGRSMILNDLFK